jgi:hypothetical protein
MTVPANIQSDIQARISMVSGIIDNALTITNQYLGVMGFIVNPGYMTSEQSAGAAGASAPPIDALKPQKPHLDKHNISPSEKYISSFQMPEAGEIDDDSDVSGELNYQEPQYSDWMLPEIRTKILDGFNSFAMTVQIENSIWSRHTGRLIAARNEAFERRATRWSGRGFPESSDSLGAGQEEIAARFGYEDSDNTRIRVIKTAELKDDNRKASISAGLKGEAIVIQHHEDIATRALDAAEATLRLGIEAFKQNVGKYSDVTVEQWMNDLIFFTDDLKIKIDQSKADVGRYITNTRLISSRNKSTAFEFEGDTDAFAADAFNNEAKGDINVDFNSLAIQELDTNLDLQLEAIKANMNAFLKKAEIQSGFTERMGTVYSNYLTHALQSISVLLSAGSSDMKEISA